ncbi:hypothetical protein DY000_02018535 [Brassica cretica]|uniref:Uncharacterized protein n=1 Tax=Brassica cretica TaxID=69181 RepID=A0ABQ7CXS7_BRACR|nr:hypothetical protein DY000_02018535 [Brassica cretica]
MCQMYPKEKVGVCTTDYVVSAMFVNIEKEKVSVCTTVFFDQESYEVDAVVRLNKKMLLTDRELVALDWMWSHGKSSASKNEIFSELEPLDRGGGLGGAGDGGSNGGNVVICELTSVGSERISITCFEVSNDHHPKAVSDSEPYAGLEFCSAN